MNRKSKLSITQQDKLQQLQLEIEALEKKIDKILKEQVQLTARNNSPIYLNDRLSQKGIRLAHDVES